MADEPTLSLRRLFPSISQAASRLFALFRKRSTERHVSRSMSDSHNDEDSNETSVAGSDHEVRQREGMSVMSGRNESETHPDTVRTLFNGGSNSDTLSGTSQAKDGQNPYTYHRCLGFKATRETGQMNKDAAKLQLTTHSALPLDSGSISHQQLSTDTSVTGDQIHQELPYVSNIEAFVRPRNEAIRLPTSVTISAGQRGRGGNAEMSSAQTKAVNSINPPTVLIYHHSGRPDFNIFQDGFLGYPDLCMLLASHLPIDDLVSLYAISRAFHHILDERFTNVVLNQAKRKAYESSRVFSFRCYAHLCREDPSARIPHPNPSLANAGIRRMVPSFRWLKFVLHREKTIQEVMAVFAKRGCPLPDRCSFAMKLIWFLFDIPDNARCIGFVHCRTIFTDVDILHAICFIVKLDMLCNKPMASQKRDDVRKMLFSSIDGFDTIHKVLTGQAWRNQLEVIRATLRYNSEILSFAEEHRGDVKDVFGVPVSEVGMLRKEYWGFKKTKAEQPIPTLLRPDQLIMMEAVRRGFGLSKHFFRSMQHGYVNNETMEGCDPRDYGRHIRGLEDEEYNLNDVVGGIRALDAAEGGDPLLDIGDTYAGSPFCIKRETPSAKELDVRRQQEERLHCYMDAWKKEVQRSKPTDS